MSVSIRIDQAQLTKSGKSYKITSGGKTFYAKPEQGIHDLVGQTIEAEVKASEYNGVEMWWINSYQKVRQDAVQTPVSSAPTIYSASPIAPIWLSMCSNICAQAVLAGHVKEPADLRPWVFAVKSAIESAMKPDEDIGF